MMWTGWLFEFSGVCFDLFFSQFVGDCEVGFRERGEERMRGGKVELN